MPFLALKYYKKHFTSKSVFFWLQMIETKGSFKNYVDKMRSVGGQKMLLFVPDKDKKCPR